MSLHSWRQRLQTSGPAAVLGVVVLAALYLVQTWNFLLFHSLVELFSILIAFALFILVWHAPPDVDAPFLVVLGVAYLFVGGIDLLHTLAYDGMGVFPDAGADLPTQLWILARSLEAVALVAAGTVGITSVRRTSFDIGWGASSSVALLVGFGAVAAAGLVSIFVLDVFPTTYQAGEGITQFKVVSEYVIIGLLGVALALLYLQRQWLDPVVYRYFVVAILLTMGSELAFLFYVSVYGFSNAVGHFLKLGSFYLFYSAAVKTGLRDPQRTLYRFLTDREQRFRRAAEAAGHAILVTDTDGSLEYVNPAFEEITGYAASEVIGENPRILKSGEMPPSYYEKLWETIQAGDVWRGQIANRRKSGQIHWAQQTIAPITDDDGSIDGYVGILTDITDLRQREEQLRVIGRVLRHNIRNDMNVIRGRAELVQSQTPAEVATQAAKIIEKSDELIALANKERLVAETLIESREQVPTDLAVLVRQVTSTLSREFPNATLDIECQSQVTVTVTPHFELAIEELVRNAIVHNDLPASEVTVAITVATAGDSTSIQVRDNGPAIPDKERAILDGEQSHSQTVHGSGLGLWFVYLAVTQSDGTIAPRQVDPRGNVVEISLPTQHSASRPGNPRSDPETRDVRK